MRSARPQQRGSALMAALFLVVVVAALGVFALRLQGTQQQVATLQLLEYRALAAANAGLEYASREAATAAPGTLCNAVALTFPQSLSSPGLQGFTVELQCNAVLIDTDSAYEIEATATHSTFGRPDFVQRTARRYIAPGFNVFD